MTGATLDQARAGKAKVVELLGDVACVVGVGITRVGEDYAVKVNLSESPPPGLRIPTEIDGVPVRVEVTGALRPR